MTHPVEWIKKRDTAIFEITHVARRQCKLVRLRRCGYEHVGLGASLANRTEMPAQFAGAPCDRTGYGEYLASFRQEPLEPMLDPGVWFPVQAEMDLLNSDNA